MKQRCTNDALENFHNYGGRGIKVCARWMESFENFLADMGEKPNGMRIERKDNDGNYEPSNCKWATNKEQSINRRTSRLIEFNGQVKTITDWAAVAGMTNASLAYRLKQGMSIELAISTPKQIHRLKAAMKK